MKVLVVGSGGREHALAWRLKESPSVREVIAAPGNPGISRLARCFDVEAGDLGGLAELARAERVDLTVVGPEAPLAAGLADRFRKEKLAVFGPTKAAARLEASKAFAKRLMQKHKIPTADFRVFEDVEKALAHVRSADYPLVVKADGLAAGKGVTVCQDSGEAERAVEDALVRRVFGEAGVRLVVEECLTGPELSVMCLTDGRRILVLAPCQDHKRLLEGDRGPNTGGMGAVSPVSVAAAGTIERVEREILVPTVHALRAARAPFQGLLYAGLMLTPGGPKVLEFNVRFGDPETQALLLRLKGDFAELLASVARGRLEIGDIRFEGAAVCIVAAAEGYPGGVRKGDEIQGLDEAQTIPGVRVFQAGTALSPDGRLLTAGGRVLGVTAEAADLASAREAAYRAIGRVRFDGMRYRKDIGIRAAIGHEP